MSYICQTYGPAIIDNTVRISIERLHRLADLARDDICPNMDFSNYECMVWIIMRELIEFGENKYNHYNKLPKKNSQDLHVL